MNREIKFRGFSEELKCFVYGFYHEVEAEGVGYSYIFFQGHTTPVRADSVAQFTGFIDKKGNDIYKGDIVTFDFHSKKYEVIWYDGAYYLRNGNQNARLSTTSLSGYYVIGNVFENPEMLLVTQADA